MEDDNLHQLADYSEGFQAGMDGKQFDDSKSKAWHRGWAEAQE
ncbi:hypothetical protein [Edaphobacter aggregans]|nr:hypothetical protein [Edaphobacter aggregans]